MMQEFSRQIAQWIVTTGYEDLPPSVVQATKMFIVDHVGCVIGGTLKESSRTITSVANPWGPARACCTLLGQPDATSPPLAALINGTAGHALELDDDHREGTLHPGVAVIPAAIAVAEQEGSSGRKFLLAVALGYEIMIRLGEALLGNAYWRGFHPTGICGSVGAAVTAGVILDLAVDQMTSAIGIGVSQSSGLLTFRSNGAWTKRFQAGNAAMAGVIAAYLAQANFLGPSESIRSPEGWLTAFSYNEQYDSERIIVGLGKEWHLLTTSVKVHACCRFAAPIVDATLEVVTRENLKPDDVAEAVVAMARYPLTRSLTEPRDRKYNPTSVVDAQFSAPFAAAVAIVKRRAFVDEYSEVGIRDAAVLDVAQRVRWEIDPEAESVWPKRYPCEVRIRRTDGTTVKARIEWPKGDPENPVRHTELEEKFRSLSEPVLGSEKVADALQLLWKIDTLDNVRVLRSVLTP